MVAKSWLQPFWPGWRLSGLVRLSYEWACGRLGCEWGNIKNQEKSWNIANIIPKCQSMCTSTTSIHGVSSCFFLKKKTFVLVLTYLIGCGLWHKPDKTLMWPITKIRSMQKKKLSCCDAQTECHLWWKANRTTTWLIVQVQSTLKAILNFHDRSHRESTVMNTR